MSLNNMRNRLGYYGGNRQLDRMNADKLRSLKKALLYSYQAATAILSDGREFRCLINPNKLSLDLDNKIISIPFRDYCLNQGYDPDPDTPSDPDVDVDHEWEDMEDLVAVLSYSVASEGNWEDMGSEDEPEIPDDPVIPPIINNGEVEIGLKEGDTITWKENGSHWLVYLKRLEETAYFRAEIRKCSYTFDIDDSTYRVFARKKDLGDISWHTAKEISWNDIDYSIEMYITKDDITQDYFHRFDIIKLNGQPWEVQAVDNMSIEGVVAVALKEHYNNTIAEEIEREQEENTPEQDDVETDISAPYIDGDTIVYPYDEVEYTIQNASGGTWSVSGKKAKIINQTDTAVIVGITSGKSGEFELIYTRENEDNIVLNITIESM